MSEFAFVRGGKNPLAAIPKPEESKDPAIDLRIGASNAKKGPDKDDGLYLLWEHCEGAEDEGAEDS